MAESLKTQAERMGLQVGTNIATYKVTNKATKRFEQKYAGKVTALYDYVFTVKNEKGRKESFTYKEFIITKEVRLVDKSRS